MAEAEDLKSSQCGFDPHSGHQFVRKSLHLGVHNSSIWINNAYTNAYTLPEDFKAMSCRSIPSQPTHLHSSKALAPIASAIGLKKTPGC